MMQQWACSAACNAEGDQQMAVNPLKRLSFCLTPLTKQDCSVAVAAKAIWHSGWDSSTRRPDLTPHRDEVLIWLLIGHLAGNSPLTSWCARSVWLQQLPSWGCQGCFWTSWYLGGKTWQRDSVLPSTHEWLESACQIHTFFLRRAMKIHKWSTPPGCLSSQGGKTLVWLQHYNVSMHRCA